MRPTSLLPSRQPVLFVIRNDDVDFLWLTLTTNNLHFEEASASSLKTAKVLTAHVVIFVGMDFFGPLKEVCFVLL